MEGFIKGETITLDNNKDYYILEIVEMDEKYLYLVSDEENPEVMIAKEVIDNNEIFVETIDDKKKIMEISEIIVERFSKR